MYFFCPYRLIFKTDLGKSCYPTCVLGTVICMEQQLAMICTRKKKGIPNNPYQCFFYELLYLFFLN